MKRLLFILTVLISFNSQAQLGEEYRNRRIRSSYQILDLKKGALFFRIRHNQREIDYLRKYNREAEANKIEEQRRSLNKRIMHAFKENFDFCEVYFFYSEYSKNLRLRQFDSIQFLDSTLTYDPKIKPEPDCFFTAEMGTVKADTAKFFDGYAIHETERGLEKKPTYVKGPDAGFKAITIMSDQFIQLVHPFPYYVRSYTANPNQKRLLWYAKKLNIALNEYYDKVKTSSAVFAKN